MDLERLSVRLRQRTDWETIDLGLTMVRSWSRPIFQVWLTLMVPLAFALILALGGWGLLIFWWLMPLGQIAVLMMLSRRVFGQETPFKGALRELPSLWRRGWLEFGLRRIIPGRSMRLAIGQLEGLRGNERRQRVRVLCLQGQETPGGLPIIILAFEFILALSILMLLIWMQPAWIGLDMTELSDQFFSGVAPSFVYTLFWSVIATAILLIDPFYIGIGFALYLNRRTHLEGWDLEISLRRLARRVQPLLAGDVGVGDRGGLGTGQDGSRHSTRSRVRAAGVPSASSSASSASSASSSSSAQSSPSADSAIGLLLAFALTLLLAGFAVAAAPAWAQEAGLAPEPTEEVVPPPQVETQWSGAPTEDPRRIVDRILLRPEFQGQEKQIRWRLREDIFDGFKDREQDSKDYSWFQGLAGLAAMFLEPLVWIVAIVLLIGIGIAAWRRLPDDAPERRENRKPEKILGLDVKPESLPDDVAGEAEKLWLAGRTTAALSLLYRGALTRLVQEGIELRESFTENDCLRVARGSLAGDRVDFLTDLTRTWQRVAYAHRLPDVERARVLWTGWNRHFGGASLGGAVR